MANLYEDLKKRDRMAGPVMPDVTSAPGATPRPGAQPSTQKAFHSAVQPGGRPAPPPKPSVAQSKAAPPTAEGAGAAVREAIGNRIGREVDSLRFSGQKLGAMFLQPAAGFGRGLLGLERPAPAAAKPAASPVGIVASAQAAPAVTGPAVNMISPTSPDFGKVRPPARPAPTGPKVNVISPTRPDFGTVRPPTRAPAAAAPPRVPAMVPGMKTLTGSANLQDSSQVDPITGERVGYTISAPARQSVASSRGKFGENVYDNASIERLTGKPMAQVREEAARQALDRPVASVAPTTEVARPQFGGGAVGASIGAPPDEERRRMQIAVDSVLARPARTRADRELKASLAQGVMEEYGQRQQIAADSSAASLAANNALASTRMQQQGENYRTELANAGESQRKRMELEAGLLPRPEYKVGADDGLLQVMGTTASAVTSADGKPVRMPREKQQINPAFSEVAKTYSTLVEAAMAQPGAAAQQAALQQIDASPTGQAYKAMLAGIAGGTEAPSVAPTLDGYIAAARKAGFTESDAELAAAFKRKYSQAQ